MSVRPEPQQFEMSQVTNDLIAARAIIAEKGWTQGAFARTFFGIAVDPDSIFARRFCASGAIVKVCGRGSSERRGAAIVILQKQVRPDIAAWNDRIIRTKEDVLAAFDKAILKSMRKDCVCLTTI